MKPNQISKLIRKRINAVCDLEKNLLGRPLLIAEKAKNNGLTHRHENKKSCSNENIESAKRLNVFLAWTIKGYILHFTNIYISTFLWPGIGTLSIIGRQVARGSQSLLSHLFFINPFTQNE